MLISLVIYEVISANKSRFYKTRLFRAPVDVDVFAALLLIGCCSTTAAAAAAADDRSRTSRK